MADATAIIGLLIGFLVVGIIGTYIGDQMISATNLTEAHNQVTTVYQNSTAGGIYQWTAPTAVTSISFHAIGGGGGGGHPNNGTMKGGAAGTAGEVNTRTGITVVPGTAYTIKIGLGGAAGAIGSNSTFSIAGVNYDAPGGGVGGTGGNLTVNGSAGLAGYSGTMTSVPSSTAGAGNTSNSTYAGAVAVGFGASGPGAGAEGRAGAGANGAIQITYTTYTNEDLRLEGQSPLVDSRNSIVDTFALGVLLCKIIIIVSIASIVFVLLQKTGLIPRFGQE